MSGPNADEEPCPRCLPVVLYQGRQYFVDLRLREFRQMSRPIEFVPFDSSHGMEMCREFAVAKCPMCRAYVIGDRRHPSKEVSCWSCGAPFQYRWFLEDEANAPGHADPSS